LGQLKSMKKSRPVNAIEEQLEKVKVNARAKVGHPFRLIKYRLAHRKVHQRGQVRSTT
jgi:IS5 family transposase